MLSVNSFESHARNSGLFSKGDKLVIAVSGGLDSVVLCELCRQVGYDFAMAHCNFQLRGEESERDEQFVRSLATRYGAPLFVRKFETERFALEQKLSIQEAARKLRYDWFAELVNEILAKAITEAATTTRQQSPPKIQNSKSNIYLLTAHHGDDNAETVLMNFCRGTGLHGLTGIPASSEWPTHEGSRKIRIKRPLLPFSRKELLGFAEAQHLDYVEDSSNISTKYTRNLFRHEVIPIISKAYPQVTRNLQDNVERFREIEKLYVLLVGRLIGQLARKKGNETHIPIRQLMSFDNDALIYHIISPFGFSEKQIDELRKLATSDSGRFIQSPDDRFRVIRHRHWFIICPVQSGAAEHVIIEKGMVETIFPGGTIRMQVKPVDGSYREQSGSHLAQLDAKEIEFPLLLRRWKPGDYFYPLGMRKKKKIARFLIDRKLSKTEKENLWVMEMNKKILWVVGHRIDDRFKVTPATTRLLEIHFSDRGTG